MKFTNDYEVDIVNNSYGYSGNIIDYTEAQVRYAFPNTIAEMSQRELLIQRKLSMYGLQEMQGDMHDQVLDYSSPELLPGMAHSFQKSKGTPLQ